MSSPMSPGESFPPYQHALLLTYSWHFLDDFILEIARKEKDTFKKSKLYDLQLTDEEWSRVQLMIKLLTVRTPILITVKLLISL